MQDDSNAQLSHGTPLKHQVLLSFTLVNGLFQVIRDFWSFCGPESPRYHPHPIRLVEAVICVYEVEITTIFQFDTDGYDTV